MKFFRLKNHSDLTYKSALKLKCLSQTGNLSKGCVSCFIKGKKYRNSAVIKMNTVRLPNVTFMVLHNHFIISTGYDML